MRNKFVLFLSTLLVAIFLVAAVPAVASACSEEGGTCEPVDDMCYADEPMSYADDEACDEDSDEAEKEPADQEPTDNEPAEQEPAEESGPSVDWHERDEQLMRDLQHLSKYRERGCGGCGC